MISLILKNSPVRRRRPRKRENRRKRERIRRNLQKIKRKTLKKMLM